MEAIELLKGNGPKDLLELTLTLGSNMLICAKKAETEEQARKMLKENIASALILVIYPSLGATTSSIYLALGNLLKSSIAEISPPCAFINSLSFSNPFPLAIFSFSNGTWSRTCN